MAEGPIEEEKCPEVTQAEIRQRAEAEALERRGEEAAYLSGDQGRVLLHELRVHEIELVLQNEELRRTQLALDASRARYFDLYELAPVGYLTLSDAGLILEANLRAAEILGTPRGELVRRPLSAFVIPEDQDRYYHFRKQLFETQKAQVSELRVRAREGAERWTRMESSLVSQEEEGHACLTTISDISEAHRLRARLAQADRLASMGLLAAGVAHEIGNPLTYVLYNLEALTRLAAAAKTARAEVDEAVGGTHPSALLDPRGIEALSDLALQALSGTRRIQEIGRGLNAFSKADGDHPTNVDLNRAVEQAIGMVSKQAEYRAALTQDLGELPPVLASEGHLIQVVVNLLVNATHAIPEGAVESNRIGVRTWTSGGEVYLEISDTGCGIAPEHLAEIFEPFFTTKGPERGTGLGLAICRQILDEIGGEVRVSSVVGEGTQVVVRLPAAVGRATPTLPAEEAAVVRGRVLVVVLRSILKKDHDVVVADSGRAAQALLVDDSAFDLVLCDLMMAGVSGVDFHRWLVEHYPRLARQLAFITGGVFTPEVSAYLRQVTNLRIDKPFDTKKLRLLVNELVRAGQRPSS